MRRRQRRQQAAAAGQAQNGGWRGPGNRTLNYFTLLSPGAAASACRPARRCCCWGASTPQLRAANRNDMVRCLWMRHRDGQGERVRARAVRSGLGERLQRSADAQKQRWRSMWQPGREHNGPGRRLHPHHGRQRRRPGGGCWLGLLGPSAGLSDSPLIN